MTESELIKSLAVPFYRDFADRMVRQVLAADAVGALYAVATSAHKGLPGHLRHKVLFRSAYVLDKIYFDAPGRFEPFAGDFCRRDFPACADASARRHFTKIMAHLLGYYSPCLPALERIAEAAAEWAVAPEAKVAVRIGAVEVLKQCRGRVDWVAESWDDLLEAVAGCATPGIECRMRKSWRPGRSR